MPDALALLIAERDRLNRAIEILEGDAAPTRKRGPGRPPGSKNKPAAAKKRGRKPMSSADRKKVSERMRKYWASRRKAAK